MKHKREREDLVAYGKKLIEEKLTLGTAGNLSIYLPESGTCLLTPSGIDYFKMKPEDIVEVDLDGKVVEGEKKPTSEWALHCLFYKERPEIGAIVHDHSFYCATLASMRKPLLPLHYVIADAGTKEVPVTGYQRFGTKELAEEAVKVAGESKAVLLANHGIICLGENLEKAFGLAESMEYLAHMNLIYQISGKGIPLTGEQMEEVFQAFEGYGQK